MNTEIKSQFDRNCGQLLSQEEVLNQTGVTYHYVSFKITRHDWNFSAGFNSNAVMEHLYNSLFYIILKIRTIQCLRLLVRAEG
jgi:hypothetical protein